MTEFGACTEFVLELNEQLAWMEHVEFTGLTINKRADDWLLIVRAKSRNGRVCTFHNAPSMVQCFRNLYGAMHRKPGLTWHPDKFSRGG